MAMLLLYVRGWIVKSLVLPFVAGGMFFLSACNSSGPAPKTEPSDAAASNSTELSSADEPLPDHSYTEKIGDIYFYTAALSENARKDGVGAKSMYGFKYLGRASNGDVLIVGVNNIGFPTSAIRCSVPCKVIRIGRDEAMSFDPDTVVGTVIADALNGKLEKTTLYESMRGK